MKVPKQPEVNIGTIGHVDHGKTTLTQALSGEWTDRHSEEIKRGISIKLGYADAAFYKYPGKTGPESFGVKDKADDGTAGELLRCVSFVDSPGHETLMATMLSGAAVMDGAMLLVAANEKCPQPQTKEHLMALDLIGVKNLIIVQNKIDLVSEERALENYKEIKAFVKGTTAEDAPIIPVSAQQGINIDLLVETIERVIPTPKRDPKKPGRLFIARSFDINKPGTRPAEIKGGVLGGTVSQGQLKVGDEIEISPGRKIEEHGRTRWEPIYTTLTGIMAGGRSYKTANAGGLLGVSTNLDPSLTKADNLVGKIAGKPGTLPDVRHSFTMNVKLLDRVVGAAEDLKVEPIKTREPLMLNVDTATTVGVVTSARADSSEVALKLPVCAEAGQRVAISRRVGARWRLIGYGVIQ
ncbi:MAG: translation initiation factor 2 subunit 3 [Thermoplasmata archaeon]|jgi:translation initiation factor 2 subunit 3|nr:translation initiation factor 2 subunit 3 [Thermoplasmata archaeon]